MFEIIYYIMAVLWLVGLLWSLSTTVDNLFTDVDCGTAAGLLVVVSAALLWPIVVVAGVVMGVIGYFKNEDEAEEES